MFSFFKKKENIHELNFRANFANFRKKYSKEINDFRLCRYGKEFGELVDEVEKMLLKTVRDPNVKVADDIIYWNATIDQILIALMDRIVTGYFVYRGMPAYETAYFVEVYKKIVEIEYKDGTINADERKIALDDLSNELKYCG